MLHIIRRLCGFIFVTMLLTQVHAAAQEQEKVFPPDQLDQLVAPIALYPDSVVAQIMMASTYPLEIVQAQRWLDQNKTLKDAELDTQGKAQGWDGSVVSMLHFPDVLKKMSENLDWTQDLGDAVLAQQKDVLDSVQRMRKKAQEEGNLQTTEQQKVVVEKEIIYIEPATEVVYVPAYNPTVVYGVPPPTPYYPWYSYPPAYWYPPAYPAGAGLVAFGVGVAWGAAVWGDCDWRGGDIDVDINRNTNINNVNGKWQHDASHRQGVRYKDNATRNRYDAQSRSARSDRIASDTDRGFDRGGSRDSQTGRRDAGASAGAGNRDVGGRTDRGGASTRDGYRDMGSGDRGTSTTRDRGAASSRDTRSSSLAGASSRDRSSGSAFSSNRSGSSARAASSRGGMSRGGGGGRGGRR